MTYEYLCASCGHAWEVEQRISDQPLTHCPNCQQETAKRQILGGVGFILKGGGWYSDLYSSKKPAEKKSSQPESTATKPAVEASSSSKSTQESGSSPTHSAS